ncbi:MAG: metal-sensitive transcriptional regulator [Clostridia bacterium]|nr:metal-sensitive transcriptional regulator [Clostridia bacterium]
MKAPLDPTLRRLRIARGQLEGIIKMVEDDRYCIDISTQLIAVTNALKNVNRDVLSAHLQHCVAESVESQDPADVEQKMDEIIKVIHKLTR